MKEFTFVVIAYNHEKYIQEHLDSIKEIVKRYGQDYDTNLLICDDCSTDMTVKKCWKWIENNDSFFSDTNIIVNDRNIGTVKNYINAIKNVSTKDFKVLAGDDVYGLFDIYSIYKHYKESILITHVKAFGKEVKKEIADVDVAFYILYEMYKKKRIKKLLLINNFIAAPGVFVPGKYLKDKGFLEFLSKYKYIEDYPSWIYLIVYKEVNVVVIDKQYIKYRVGSGISTTSTHNKNNEFLNEEEKMRKQLKIKSYIFPKYINPYRYWLKYKNNLMKVKLFLNKRYY